MTRHPRPEYDRTWELMAGEALGDLTQAESRELDALRAHDSASQAMSFEICATAVDLAFSAPRLEPMPADVQERILAAHRRSQTPLTSNPPPQRVEAASPPPIGPVPAVYKLGWLAAAACLIVAIMSWWPRGGTPAPDAYAVVDQQPDIIQTEWTFNDAGGADSRFANVSGEVHWSTVAQDGYMEFLGLPINDPAKQQYQLWIVDPTRDTEPVDGGVFDVTGSGRVRVPIRPKLRIERPAAFALTVEKPGGVVVSEGPLQLVATVKNST
jgi:hypothetical protein